MITVLHALDHSLPEHDGYAFRSHSILTQLARAGVPVDVVTGPKQGYVRQAEDLIDGIRYRRTVIPEGLGTDGILGQIRTISLMRKSLRQSAEPGRAGIIHAHSPCLNGLAALKLGVPVIYEMRSSWEDAAVSVGTTREGSIRYRVSRMLETWVAKRADAVVVICEGLKSELIDRGIQPDKIVVVPNALSDDMFAKPSAAAVDQVRHRYELNDCRTVGFFGSFFEWEGIDVLIYALREVAGSIPNVRLLIAGGGRQESYLRDLVDKLSLESQVVFAGRIPHGEISAYYAAMDVMAYPRKSDRLTEMVTPLKPLEAMAQGVPVVASDVGGHKELMLDGKTGRLFKAGDRADLAATLVEILSRPDDALAMANRALETVTRERRWATVVDKYLPVYEHYGNVRGS